MSKLPVACLVPLLWACDATPTTSSLVNSSSIDRPSLRPSMFSGWSEPVSLGTAINTSFSDQQPSLSKNGLTLYFASTRPENPNDAVLDNNIWVARRACLECNWQPPVLLGGGVNTTSNDANPNLSRDEHFLFFASNRVAAGAQGGMDLWVSYREHVHDDFGWQPPVNLGPGVNTSAGENGPAYFENDEFGVPQLFFQRAVGAGTNSGDIYVSELSAEGVWGTASAVAELNSSAADQRPSIRHDGLAIYFWSGRDAGRPNLGDAYLWYATRESLAAPWSAPRLVDDPVNCVSAAQPFIHSRGHTETLLFIRNVGSVGAANLDLFMSTRTRGGRAIQPPTSPGC